LAVFIPQANRGMFSFFIKIIDSATVNSSIYRFSANSIDGQKISLDEYRGKVCLIVNVASFCTHSFSSEDYASLRSRPISLLIRLVYTTRVGPITNTDSLQEPGSNEDVKKRLLEKYKIGFQLFEKVDVNGSNAHPLFHYLQNALPGTLIK
uniref:Glutathione peroxidase n=1 Tax=Echinostoma caproni TaxID=27848 RepID=A0A183ANG3_9TREM